MSKYNEGDEVYWNDPDDGACSGVYTVLEIIAPDFGLDDIPVYKLIDKSGGQTEAFEYELT